MEELTIWPQSVEATRRIGKYFPLAHTFVFVRA